MRFPSLAHQDLLEEEQTRVDHAFDVLSICHFIVDIEREVITILEFQEGTS